MDMITKYLVVYKVINANGTETLVRSEISTFELLKLLDKVMNNPPKYSSLEAYKIDKPIISWGNTQDGDV